MQQMEEWCVLMHSKDYNYVLVMTVCSHFHCIIPLNRFKIQSTANAMDCVVHQVCCSFSLAATLATQILNLHLEANRSMQELEGLNDGHGLTTVQA